MRVLAADIETGSAEDIHSADYEFVRLCGWKIVGSNDPVTISTDPQELIAAIDAADAVTWHFGLGFDAMALALHNGADYEAMAAKSFDTLLVERHLNPVAAKGAQPNGYYKLDATSQRYGGPDKSKVGFDGKLTIVRRVKGDKVADRMLAARVSTRKRAEAKGTEVKPWDADRYGVLDILKDLYGGYHLIPPDDPDYRHYLAMDVEAQEALFLAQIEKVNALPVEGQRYLRREHAITAAFNRSVTMDGFKVDVDETMTRWADGQARLEAGKKKLADRYGMPTDSAMPHRTNLGKAAFRAALLDTGISETALDANWPRGKDGSLLTGKDVLNEMIGVFDRAKPAAADLCRIVLEMNGEKSFPGTILSHLTCDRVHPSVQSSQSSGRFGVTNPGLTVAAKRGPKGAWERGILLPDNEDEVLVAIDANAVDVRMVAAMSGDTEFHKLFLPGVDFHSTVADKVFGRHDGDWRRLAKIGGIGSLYGLGANGMAVQMGVEVDLARDFLRGMDESFPGVAAWKQRMRAEAGAVGFDEDVPENDSYRILTNPFGRPVRVERKRAYTQACALLGQSATRDGMAQAVLNLPAWARKRIKVIVHDELVFSLPREGVEQVSKELADSMAFNLLGVDITFGLEGWGENWHQVYEH